MFEPKKFDSGKVLNLPITASSALVRFSLCKMSSGYLVTGAAGDNEVEYVCLETVTGGATDGATYADVLPIDDEVEFEALTSATPVQATHVGNDYDIEAAASVDLGNTTDKVFHIDSIKSAADKIVRGRFNKPAIA